MNELLKVLNYYDIEPDDKIICPFHADKNPSMSIDIQNNFWFCFGCQEGGDAFKFHKKMQNQLGNNNEIKISRLYQRIINGKEKKNGKILNIYKTKPIEIKDKAYYRQCLIEAKDYYYGLKSVDWFDDEADDECKEYMRYRGFKMSTLNKAGAKYTYKDISYPIVFPLLDNGRFKGWVSRSFDHEISETRKYLYNKGFRRRTTIVGDYKDTDRVILVEGYMDYLKGIQNGAKNICAILGWKITDQQIKKLKNQGVVTIISALDNDACGNRGSEYLKKYFNVIRFPYPKYIKDMGDLDKRNFDRIMEDLENGTD